MDKTKDLSAFERGMVEGARRTGLCQELQRCWVFNSHQFPVCVENGPPPKGYQGSESLWSYAQLGLDSVRSAPPIRVLTIAYLCLI